MLDAAILPAIDRALKGLRYGHVQLVVHDGQLVRIERVERIRLPSVADEPAPLTESLGSHTATAR